MTLGTGSESADALQVPIMRSTRGGVAGAPESLLVVTIWLMSRPSRGALGSRRPPSSLRDLRGGHGVCVKGGMDGGDPEFKIGGINIFFVHASHTSRPYKSCAMFTTSSII